MSHSIDSAQPSVFDDLPCAKELSQNADARQAEACGMQKLTPAELAPDGKRFAMSLVRSWADAEEIVQEAFCKLVQASPESPEHSRFDKALFFRIVRNRSIDLLRSKNRRQFQTLNAAEDPIARRQPDDGRLSELESEVTASLTSMPNEWSDALKLKLNAKLSYDEIATVLCATRAQVRTWIFRARKRLRNDLTERGLIENEKSK